MLDHDIWWFFYLLLFLYLVCSLTYEACKVIPSFVVDLITGVHNSINGPLVAIALKYIRSSLVFGFRGHPLPHQTKVEVNLINTPLLAIVYETILRELRSHAVKEANILINGVYSWLDWVFGVVVLAGLDLVGRFIELGRQLSENHEAEIIKRIEGPPIRLLLTGSPIRLLITCPPVPKLVDGVRKLIEAPRLLITGPPVSHIQSYVHRLLVCGPPVRHLIESPCLLITGPPAHPNVDGPFGPAQLFIEGPPTRKLVTGPPACKLVTGPPVRQLITAVPIRGFITYPTSPGISTLDEATSSQGEVVDEEVSDSGFQRSHIATQDVKEFLSLTSDWRLVLEVEAKRREDNEATSESISPALSEDDATSKSISRALSSDDASSSNTDSSSDFSVGSPGSYVSPASSPEPSAPKVAFLDPNKDPFLVSLPLDSLKPVGRGGFGAIWKATGPDGKSYALKVVDRSEENDERLMNEIEALDRASGSRWAIEMQGYTMTDDKYFLTFARTASLADLRMDVEGLLRRTTAYPHTVQILGVHDLHVRGILHGDIKPETVMIQDGHIRITDFGFAELFNHGKLSKKQLAAFHHLMEQATDAFPPLKNSATNPHIISSMGGTPGYSAPEVRKGYQCSFGVGFYSAGVVLHYLLTGLMPYEPAPKEAHGYNFDEQLIDPEHVLTDDEYHFVERMIAPNPFCRPTVHQMKTHPIFSHI
ncbi:Serine/threonine-protein kinase sid2 [Leucoagaricus sp. SymC.cos]|nr:Serine/threonine-protein kinase sid2 [Leucoagaricus sp. SymC.cos]KXN92993.1 Serine/threonine-protein kinase sid2 [Leucoagaricus sp. SymC.cos]